MPINNLLNIFENNKRKKKHLKLLKNFFIFLQYFDCFFFIFYLSSLSLSFSLMDLNEILVLLAKETYTKLVNYLSHCSYFTFLFLYFCFISI